MFTILQPWPGEVTISIPRPPSTVTGLRPAHAGHAVVVSLRKGDHWYIPKRADYDRLVVNIVALSSCTLGCPAVTTMAVSAHVAGRAIRRGHSYAAGPPATLALIGLYVLVAIGGTYMLAHWQVGDLLHTYFLCGVTVLVALFHPARIYRILLVILAGQPARTEGDGKNVETQDGTLHKAMT